MRRVNGSPLSFLLHQVKRHAASLPVVIAFSVCASLGWLAAPLAARIPITQGLLGTLTITPQGGTIVLVAVILLGGVTYAANYLIHTAARTVAAGIRRETSAHLLSLPFPEIRRHNSGELVERISSATTEIERFLVQGLSTAFGSAIMAAGALGALLVIDTALAALLIAGLSIPGLLLRPLIASTRQMSRVTAEATGRISASIQEALAGIVAVKAFSAEVLERKRHELREREELAAHARYRKRAALIEPLLGVIALAVLGAMLAVGADRVRQGSLPSDQLVAFGLYAGMLVPLVRWIGILYASWQGCEASLQRILELLRIESEDSTSVRSPERRSPAGHLSVRSVFFAYPDGTPVLRGLTFDLSPGDHVALVGHTGAGKTTLFHLLLRLYDPQTGAIAVDGQDLSRLTVSEARSLFALVPQDPSLIDGTIRENVLYGRPDAPAEEVQRACRVARIDQMFGGLPRGLDTSVGERGLRLSGGQRQLVALARAVLKQAPVMLLDEATSAVDSVTEAVVQSAVAEAIQSRTSITIAHRLSTVVHLPRILVLHDGVLAASGSHDELLADCELYRSIVQNQLVGAGEGLGA